MADGASLVVFGVAVAVDAFFAIAVLQINEHVTHMLGTGGEFRDAERRDLAVREVLRQSVAQAFARLAGFVDRQVVGIVFVTAGGAVHLVFRGAADGRLADAYVAHVVHVRTIDGFARGQAAAALGFAFVELAEIATGAGSSLELGLVGAGIALSGFFIAASFVAGQRVGAGQRVAHADALGAGVVFGAISSTCEGFVHHDADVIVAGFPPSRTLDHPYGVVFREIRCGRTSSRPRRDRSNRRWRRVGGVPSETQEKTFSLFFNLRSGTSPHPP